ncbi:ribonuclease domain-containing protein [Candidatus Nitrosacidococcus tergens]|uniref:Ribonuclease n=1 Tax=Candidatus Nitrosacidococcus tergens TaxID=553981 RepID=A0A7G1QAT5_9GAMM|nr:ribonuclease domain-containing protein [Candidatus Nitrosacidococcus tergens]CAB1276555.1 Guanine-specific ribonuclease N1 and T1 [Candidatus Nitrosacidococcus tergens]
MQARTDNFLLIIIISLSLGCFHSTAIGKRHHYSNQDTTEESDQVSQNLKALIIEGQEKIGQLTQSIQETIKRDYPDFFENIKEKSENLTQVVQNITGQNNQKLNHNLQYQEITQLTQPAAVVAYLKEYRRLPDYYLTKNQARHLGWIPSKGNLCDILPNHAIGGDRFGNREKRLPMSRGRAYFEADLNYQCGRRGADRLIYSSDGLIFITQDHYETFQPQ